MNGHDDRDRDRRDDDYQPYEPYDQEAWDDWRRRILGWDWIAVLAMLGAIVWVWGGIFGWWAL